MLKRHIKQQAEWHDEFNVIQQQEVQQSRRRPCGSKKPFMSFIDSAPTGNVNARWNMVPNASRLLIGHDTNGHHPRALLASIPVADLSVLAPFYVLTVS